MSCGTCSEKTKAGASAVIGAPMATGGVAGRKRRCPHCGQFANADGTCANTDCWTRAATDEAATIRDARLRQSYQDGADFVIRVETWRELPDQTGWLVTEANAFDAGYADTSRRFQLTEEAESLRDRLMEAEERERDRLGQSMSSPRLERLGRLRQRAGDRWWRRSYRNPSRQIGLQSPLDVPSIKWNNRKPIHTGSNGVVYQVAPGIVAKVGHVDPGEVDVQLWAEEHNYGLPVYNYQERVDLPGDVSREVCPVHGARRGMVAPDSHCECGRAVAVLVMPEAREIGADLAKSDVVVGFQKIVNWAVEKRWGARFPACRPGHVMRWNGNMVCVGFNSEQGDGR